MKIEILKIPSDLLLKIHRNAKEEINSCNFVCDSITESYIDDYKRMFITGLQTKYGKLDYIASYTYPDRMAKATLYVGYFITDPTLELLNELI